MNSEELASEISSDDLACAIASNNLRLVYQPIVSAQSARTVCLEALLRMKLPNGAIATPNDFIGVAELSGLIYDLGEWALRQACCDALRWRDMRVSVNVSPLQLQFPGFVKTVRRILNETGLPPERLELEITEHSPIEDLTHAYATMAALRKIGIRLAIDDFGAGYSGLIYLRRLPIDKIKIDRSFIESIETREAEILVRSIARLGLDLALTVTAEGVETADHQRILTEAGCQELQGYFFSRPLPAADIDTLFGSGAAAARLRFAGAA